MNDIRAISEPVLSAKGTRLCVFSEDSALSYASALHLLASSHSFREFLTQLIVCSSYTALRWETPPIATSTIGRHFEFVLVNDPFLEDDPEPDVFGPYFASRPLSEDVLAVPNLGGTAKLVVPRQITDPGTYVHLKGFLQGAPATQVHSLWQCVARTAQDELSERPLWLSTAGGGVKWLHVRLEPQPKYYVYRPYANGA